MAKKDLTGQRFGRWTVIKEYGKNKQRCTTWWCRCDCGNEGEVSGTNLTHGRSKSCGCLRNDKSSKRLKEQWKDEEYREMKREQLEETNKRLWSDEEYVQMVGSRTKKLWENEDFKQKMSENISERNKINWENEEYRKAHSGKNNPNYNPNLTNEDREEMYKKRKGDQDFKKWSKQVKERDNFTCDICGQKHGGLVSHHLNAWRDYKEQRYDLENGVCLCESCHKEFHKLYGKGDNTKEQYIEFKENKLTKQEQ